MSSATKVADEYAAIAKRLAEIKAEEDKAKYGEMPEVQPDYTPIDYMYGVQRQERLGGIPLTAWIEGDCKEPA